MHMRSRVRSSATGASDDCASVIALAIFRVASSGLARSSRTMPSASSTRRV